MYYPSVDKVKELAKASNLVPVYREIMADLETPVSAYLKIARGQYSFLLESVEGSERIARYSFIGTEPYRVLRAPAPTPGRGPGDKGTDPLKEIETELARFSPAHVDGLPRFHGGAVGYLTYDAVRHFERLPSPKEEGLGLPESVFLLMDTVVVFDHRQHKIQVVSHAHVEPGSSGPAVEKAYREAIQKIDLIAERLRAPLKLPAPEERRPAEAAVDSNMTKEEYFAMVARTREYIIAGDIIQGVMSQRLRRKTAVPALDLYRSIRAINPSPYMFYLEMGDFQLVGASPELLVRVEGDRVMTNPIAGTRRRGATEEEDLALEAELRNDKKEQAEHIMLVDLGRNDIGRVSQPGTVKVDQLMDVERYSHVMHLVSQVSGKLKKGMTCYDALRSCFPAGTVSGAPKIRAMEIIAELEPDRRGAYAGAVGYFDFTGNMDTCIAIRTMVVRDGTAYVQAGGGIVYDSQPESEFQETLSKAAALLRAIHEAEVMEQWVGERQQQGAEYRLKRRGRKERE
ncbi:MAG: trpE [Dehalococcoidia bacterium]|nr:trpE [Dehalococcoidia bacterium]